MLHKKRWKIHKAKRQCSCFFGRRCRSLRRQRKYKGNSFCLGNPHLIDVAAFCKKQLQSCSLNERCRSDYISKFRRKKGYPKRKREEQVTPRFWFQSQRGERNEEQWSLLFLTSAATPESFVFLTLRLLFSFHLINLWTNLRRRYRTQRSLNEQDLHPPFSPMLDFTASQFSLILGCITYLVLFYKQRKKVFIHDEVYF